jgi:peptide/nickel transport system substrate-binding protein
MRRQDLVPRAAALLAAAVASIVLAACGGSSTTSTNGGAPKPGGSITVGGLVTSLLDPGQPGYSAQSAPIAAHIFGTLFLPAASPKGDVQPNLATGYGYNADKTVLTLKIRPDVKFSDGTPMDVAAVVWNLRRYDSPSSLNHQYFGSVSSIDAGSDPNTVVVRFKSPYTLLPTALASTATGFMASKTALEKLGPEKFNLQPVGAGPFKVTTVDPGNKLVLAKSDQYWDKTHVYLDKVTYLNTGTDPSASYVNLQSGAIQAIQFSGTTIAAGVVTQALNNKNLKVEKTPNTFYAILPINTFKAPFNNLDARQALAYCTDRETITKNVTQGLTTPAYVLSGTDSFYLKDGVNAAKSLNPINYDVQKGSALVKQLGGLSFTMIVQANSDIIAGLQQQWAQCGIKATITVSNNYLTSIQNGSYQASYTTVPNLSYNPTLWTTYQDPMTPQGKFGFKDADITDMIDKAKTLSDEAELENLWHQIWTAESKLAVDIPILSAPNYIAVAKCLDGVETQLGAQYTHGYLAC